MTNDHFKRETLTDRMREAREKDVVGLQSYNILRSKNCDAVVLALEGYDDPAHYMTMIRAVDSTLVWIPHVCNGKDRVLALRELLKRNSDADSLNTYYIVDKDFDGLKGHVAGEDIYCTTGYSIENSLVTTKIFAELLICEFKCNSSDAEVTNLNKMFEDRLHEFFTSMALANRALHYCRIKRIRSGAVENRIKKYIQISLDSVTAKYDETDLEQLIGFNEGLDVAFLSETAGLFGDLDPNNDWRGKFVLSFFVEFLAQLQEDRSSHCPAKFENRRSLSFNPRTSLIRLLSSMVEPPRCFQNFVVHITA